MARAAETEEEGTHRGGLQDAPCREFDCRDRGRLYRLVVAKVCTLMGSSARHEMRLTLCLVIVEKKAGDRNVGLRGTIF